METGAFLVFNILGKTLIKSNQGAFNILQSSFQKPAAKLFGCIDKPTGSKSVHACRRVGIYCFETFLARDPADLDHCPSDSAF